MTEVVEYSVEEGVATITLNRPDRLNALNGAMYQGLIEAFDQTDGDDRSGPSSSPGPAALSAPAPT